MRTILNQTIKIFEWVVFLSLIIVLFLVGSSLLPTKNIFSTFSVSTGSMEPNVPTNSLVLVSSSSQYDIGDVIVFPSPDRPDVTIVHRVVDILGSGEGTAYVTKGDANDTPDSWEVGKEDVVGNVFYSVPYVGGLISTIRTPSGFAMIMVIPMFILLLFQIKRIREGINEEIERRTNEEVNKRLADLQSESINSSELERQSQDIKKVTQLQNYWSFAVFPILFLMMFFSTEIPNAYASFNSKATMIGLTISTSDKFPDDFQWSGGLEIINKTTGEGLNIDQFTGRTVLSENVVFRPIVLEQDAHHFTTIIKKMSNDSMVQYRTMLTRWTIDNFRQDGHMGYTFWETGDYWLQVNAYRADGSVEGSYYAVLTVEDISVIQNFVVSEEITLEGLEQVIEIVEGSEESLEEEVEEVSLTGEDVVSDLEGTVEE